MGSEHELVGIFQEKNPAYPGVPSSRVLSYKYRPPLQAGQDADRSRALAWGSFSFFRLNKFILLLTNAVDLFALKK